MEMEEHNLMRQKEDEFLASINMKEDVSNDNSTVANINSTLNKNRDVEDVGVIPGSSVAGGSEPEAS